MSALGRLKHYALAARGAVHNGTTLARTLGQFTSMSTGTSVDAQGDPLPWFTYPAIDYLAQFDYSDKTVFEFGAGNSTVFWGQRCKQVTAVEHDRSWFESVDARLGDNAVLIHADNEADYTSAITRTEETFDVIVLDGWYRMACAQPALERLRPGGVVILDNSDWLPATSELLRSGDLIQVDFSGFGPICTWRWTTSMFLSRTFDFASTPPARPHPPGGGSPPPDSAAGL